jgi:hypothetical protein
MAAISQPTPLPAIRWATEPKGKRKTWKILRWDDEPKQEHGFLPFDCERCGTEAWLAVGMIHPHPIAIKGMGAIFDIPDWPEPQGYWPTEIKCRTCRHVYSMTDGDNVR